MPTVISATPPQSNRPFPALDGGSVATDRSMRPSVIPDLDEFHLHRSIADVDFEGWNLPGLYAYFYRKTTPAGILSVGLYRLRGFETHRAWGWVGEEHCSYHAVTDPYSGRSQGPIPGCPDFTVLHGVNGPYGFTITDAAGLCRTFLLDL